MTNRDIKFRAWNTSHEAMLDASYVQDKSLEWLTTSEWIVPMQFTGLKDKNGKEIYEGDIVMPWQIYSGKNGKVLSAPFGGKNAFEVEWHQSTKKVGWNIAEGKKYEVIGNIYENPSLL